ncbi:unnamed protein product, partial [Brachionus calyciflorus]
MDNLGVEETIVSNLKLTKFILNLTNFKNLETITFKSNQIENLEIYLGYKPKNLKIVWNEIRNFKLKNCQNNLDYLDLIGNDLNFQLPTIPNLITLHLDNNNFNSIQKDLFSRNLPILKNLYLTTNNLSYIEIDSFINFKNLEYLKLSDNLLDESLQLNDLNILHLSLDRNRFKSFSSSINLNGTLNLKYLDLSHNFIEIVNINLKYLELLEIDNNPIKIIDELISKKVILSRIYFNFDLSKFYLSQIIDLSNNNLNLISIEELSKLSNLIELNLANNKIEILEFPILINLQILIVSFNKLKFIKLNTFSKLFNLSELYLTGNLIKFIETNSFIHNKKLKILYLDSNYLSFIPDVSSKILNLNYQNGNLVYLDKQAFENKNLNEILLSYNNITSYNPHVFCSNGLKDTKISIDNLKFINKCVLKQLAFKNISFNLLENQSTDCNLFKMANKYNVSFGILGDVKCSNNFNDDCDQEYNLKFDCKYNLSMFERDSIEIYALNSSRIESNLICVESDYFIVYCSLFSSKNGTYQGLIYSYKFVMTDKKSNFQLKKISDNSIFVYHIISQTILLIFNLGEHYSIIIKSTRYFLNRLIVIGDIICYDLKDKQDLLNNIGLYALRLENEIKNGNYRFDQIIGDLKK